jgi:hypothetical protein
MSDYYDVVLNNADPSNCVFVEVEDANKRSVNVPLIQWVTAEERGDVYPALRVNIAAHDKEVLDKAVERVMARDGYIIGFDDYADGWLVGRNDAVAAIRGDDDVCGCGPTACDLHREARHEVAKRRADIHGEGEK